MMESIAMDNCHIAAPINRRADRTIYEKASAGKEHGRAASELFKAISVANLSIEAPTRQWMLSKYVFSCLI